MKSAILFIFLFLGVTQVQAQSLIPLDFNPEDDNTVISENDSFKYYVAAADTTHIVCINEETSFYKLLNKAHKLMTDGYFIVEGDKYLQDGRWTQRYDNGKVKITGYYSRSKPIGAWQEYYSTGKLKTVYNYAIIGDNGSIYTCLSGTYQEYYPDGKLKVNGFYSANGRKVNDTTVVDDPVSDRKVTKVLTRFEYTPEKTGHWDYYTETGEPEKKDDQ